MFTVTNFVEIRKRRMALSCIKKRWKAYSCLREYYTLAMRICSEKMKWAVEFRRILRHTVASNEQEFDIK